MTLLSLEDGSAAVPRSANDLQHLAIAPAADRDGALAAWLAARGARWAIVRPDRYVHSTAATQAQLANRLADLSERSGVTAPALETQP